MFVKNQKAYKRIALILSLCAILIWCILGTGASLAWFKDTSDINTNIFHTADFELVVSHRQTDGNWKKIDSQTDIFDNQAIYEPGYTQVVYLRVDNTGDVAFNFRTAVTVTDYSIPKNIFGKSFVLQDYLKFGLTASDSEDAMKNSVPDRETAVQIANTKLSNYETETATLQAGESKYIALVVRMPEGVGNEANYRGPDVPRVDLGIIVSADQIIN